MMRRLYKVAKVLLLSAFMLTVSLLSKGDELDRNTIGRKVADIRLLYQNGMYISVQSEVDRLIPLAQGKIGSEKMAEIKAYSVMSSIHLEAPNIDGVVVEFEDDYPGAASLARVKFLQSVYYFDRKEYSRSLSIMEEIVQSHLPKEEKIEYMFNRAFCQMRGGMNDQAEVGFKQIISLGNTPYKSASTYYLAYIYYISNEFYAAVELYEELKKNNEYALFSKYYLAESYFMLKKYDKVISYGEEIYEKLQGDFKQKCVRIVSQAYFEQNNTKEAKRYLEMYSEESDKLSRKDNYYSGVVSYTLESYYAAIDAFSKVVQLKDSLGQSAYLHLGNSYLKIKNKPEALKSFKAASELGFDEKIKEESYFLYAKLAFDLNSDVTPFNQYISNYPVSSKVDEIYSYIAVSYLQKKNFKGAISALEKVQRLTPSMKNNLQKAAFFRGMQLLDMGSYTAAVDDFKLSLKYASSNQSLAMLTKFWMGEAYFRLEQFVKTVEQTSPLIRNLSFNATDEYPMALMNMGYSFYRLEDYASAKQWFEEYLKLAPSRRNMTMEAKTRLADSYYMLKDYERAAELYEEVAGKTFDKDDIYATYMGAISYGLLSMPEKKISMLGDIIENKPDSDYYHESVFELGRTYVQNDEPTKAIECFNLLLNNRTDSTYHSKSYLELGMIHSNMSKYDQALEYFKIVVERNPLSDDAHSALAGIESVYQIQNKPELYLAYIESIGMSSIKSADEKEQMLFNSAEQIFLAGKYSESISSLNSFLEKYPSGQKASQAYFYLGDAYSKSGNPEFAADAYLKVMNIGDGAFAELATLYYGKIQLSLEKFDQAAGAFETLSAIAQLDNNKFEAMLGKMRAYYGGGKFEKALSEGGAVLKAESANEDIRREAEYIVAKSHLSLGEREEALAGFKKLASDYISEEGAESAFMVIQYAYDEGNFDQVENLVYAFSDSETPHNYWLAKSFIVLGDSFAEREEWAQAKATFESVKEGYTPEKEHDDILEQVELRLSKIVDYE